MNRPVDYLDTLAEFASSFNPAKLPEHVKERSKWILADTIGVIAAGMKEKEMVAFSDVHLQTCAPGPAWVIGAGTRSNALAAAFLNGIAGTWHELDEGNTLSKGHPGIQLIPAALATAQETKASGQDLLTAIAIAYEVSSRINRASQIRPSIHPHGTFGVIGAALAVARLCKAPPASYRRLINIAAGLPLASSYSTLDDGATVRNVFTGHSAFMGINAVRLAAAGFTGERDGVLTSFGSVLGDAFDPDVAIAGLGSDWMVSSGYFKLQPTARSIHPAIDATQDALKKAPEAHIPAKNIKAVYVRTFALAARKNQKNIKTSFGAKFSIPFAVATQIVNGRATLDCFDQDNVENPCIQTLSNKVNVAEDSGMSAAYPALQMCTVQIYLVDGRVYEGKCDIARGEPERPNVLPEIREKFMTLTAPMWGSPLAASLFKDCLSLEGIPEIAKWSTQYIL